MPDQTLDDFAIVRVMGKYAWPLVIGALILGGGLYLSLRDRVPSQRSASELSGVDEGPGVGQRAPNFTLRTFDGDAKSLQDLTKGKRVTVINFYASWCPPCREEIPYFVQIFNEKKDQGVQFIGINTQDTKSSGRDFTLAYQIDYPALFDEGGEIFLKYRGFMPSTIVLNQDLVIARRFTGAVAEDVLRQTIDQLLEES